MPFFLIIVAWLIVCLASSILYAGWQLRNLIHWNWAKHPDYRGKTNLPSHLPSVALLIPYRNEVANLPQLIRDIQAFDYPGLEVIFVDDHSEDSGARIVGAAAGAMEGTKKQGLVIRSLSLADHLQGRTVTAHKKEALAYAIAGTTADIIITTDADCRLPASFPNDIAEAFRAGNDVVLGPVLIAPPHNTFLTTFQALDFAAYQLYTAACVARRSPTLANGACFAFRRDLFLQVNGYQGLDHLPSGDDVLLLHRFAQRPDVRFAWHGGPPVLTRPVGSWAGLWKQRVRWAGKAGEYVSPSLQRGQALAFVVALFILINLAAAAVFSSLDFIITALILWVPKAIIDLVLLANISRHYGQGKLLWWYLPVLLLYPFYLVAVGTAALLGLKVGWKGR